MTLDRTKKYTVGTIEFAHQNTGAKRPWKGDLGESVIYLNDEELLKMDPVEVEEPIKWGFESDGDFPGDVVSVAPTRFAKGNWRHEVVSTRIG